jgi:hypothetical protein
MFPAILEVMISLVVIYFLLSTVVSFLKEAIAMVFNSRGKILYKSLEDLFGENKEANSLLTNVYKSDYVNNLAARFPIVGKLNSRPSYIATENFTGALIDEICKIEQEKKTTNVMKTFADIKQKINEMSPSFVKTKLLDIIAELEDSKQTTIENLKKKIGEWFDNYMISVSIIYKNYVTVWVFFISLFFCFKMNIDSLVLVEYLYENSDKRKVVVTFAESVGKDDFVISDSIKGEKRVAKIKELKNSVLGDFNSFELPYGWEVIEKSDTLKKHKVASARVAQKKLKKLTESFVAKRLNYEQQLLGNEMKGSLLTKFFGLLISTVSLTLGAPFWYQMMVNLLALRKSIREKKVA